MRRLLRTTGTLLIVAGVLTLGWAVLVWQWQDPFTAIYTTYKQHQLKDSYHKIYESYRPAAAASVAVPPRERAKPKARARPKPSGPALAAERRLVSVEARAYQKTLHEGSPLGRLIVPRLGLNIIAVNGTETSSLEKGPARYSGPLPNYVPGDGELVYIAGHRTTFLAPFAHIDRLRAGDRVTFQLPYATFEYAVTGHRIVSGDDLSVLTSHHHELLALQACHPRFFASHRYIAYARLVRVAPRTGTPYAVQGTTLIAAAA